MRLGRRFLIDIDTLFDTRLGWAEVLQPDVLEKLDLEVYRRRFTDSWAEVVGITEWDKRFAERDKRALKNAQPTEFLLTLKNEIHAMLLSIQMHSPIERPQLTFNLWPYMDLDDEERQEFLENLRAYYSAVPVDIVCISHSELTPGRLAAAWDGWVMYDWYPWIKEHAKAFSKPIPSFTITRPSLLTSELTEETIALIKRDGANPFKESTRYLAQYVTTDVKDTAMFSLRRPPRDDDSQTP
ncbi:putative virion structural protein [Salmonella phage SPAsTU]|nr:hypothetical protein STsAS_189 [Salmonella phage STsAS]AXF51114.1 putative virion structural protein [Salmonella phage SPAsTU]